MSRLTSILSFILWGLFSFQSYADDPILNFQISDKQVAELSLSDLQQQLDSVTISFFNPLMSKEKTYLSFKAVDLLDLVFADHWKSEEYSDIAFKALDGYEAVSNLNLMREDGAYFAFEDKDTAGGWEPIGRKQADPGPYFLVWTEKHQTTANAYPWPWQISDIRLIRFSDQYPAVIPKGVDAASSEYLGFKLFRSRCLRCHAMDQQGGKVGPDLNAPQSITQYRSEHMIREFIRQPSAYRYTHMPDHLDLSDADLDNLYRYFLHQSNQ